MSKSWQQKYWPLLLMLPLCSLFFIGGPDSTTLPSIKYAWNIGHIIFFVTVTGAIHNLRPFNNRRSIHAYYLILALVSLTIEVIQHFIGRDFSVIDILRNLTGATLGLIWVARPALKLIYKVVFLIFLMSDLTAFSTTVFIDLKQHQSTPVLADFESWYSLRNWQGQIVRQSTIVEQGQYAAQVTFPAGKYPGVTFLPAIRDWRDFEYFSFNIYSIYTDDQYISIRINDEHHEQTEQSYYDRFNKQLTIHKGWNKVNIPLATLQHAPKHRDMDLSKIYRLMLFYVELDEPHQLVIDDLTFVKK